MTIYTCDFCDITLEKVGSLRITIGGQVKEYHFDICSKCADKIDKLVATKEFTPRR
jgi:hypothetical protein